MKTKNLVSRVLPLVLLLGILLTGCNCKHEWKDATTEAPKTCSICQKTEGERIVPTPDSPLLPTRNCSAPGRVFTKCPAPLSMQSLPKL